MADDVEATPAADTIPTAAWGVALVAGRARFPNAVVVVAVVVGATAGGSSCCGDIKKPSAPGDSIMSADAAAITTAL